MSDAQPAIQSNDAEQSKREKFLSGRDPAKDREKAQAALAHRLADVKAKMPDHWFKQVERTPSRYLGRRLKACTGEASAKAAIKAKCEECVGYEEIKATVGECKSFACPLWTHRPYQPRG